MKQSCLFLLLFLTTTFNLFSQEDKKVEDDYAAYFTLPREGIYLHLNKTSYFTGEEIWFKGYTFDQKNQLTSKATTNINIGIYDKDGKQLKKSLVKAESGFAQGNFLIDSTYTSGTYYIKAETNWMKNFKESDAYVQKIEIITDSPEPTKKPTVTEAYDFQFLPEGGHIVANTKSNIGFKVIDQDGKGVEASGVVYDENKQKVASFQGNSLGLGKFLFQPKDNQKYTAEIKLITGELIEKELPRVKAKGVSLIVNNPFPDKVIINFSTNAETLASNPAKKYKVLIHQTGNLKTINFSFDTGNEKMLSVAKSELFKGINTITLFDEDENPILERLFFNDFFLKKAAVNVTKLNTIEDSIILSINELKLQEDTNISISILPETTKAYRPNHNIISNFYLKPYVKGTVQNPQYYFTDMDRKKKYELDILLITQGWSRYDWEDIFTNKPTRINRFESGITLNGTVNKPSSGIKQLFLHATKNHSAQFIELDKDQKFTIQNFYPEEDEEIRFSYIGEAGMFIKPSIYLRFDVTNAPDEIAQNILSQKNSNSQSADFQLPKNFFYENSEDLSAVVIEAKRKVLKKDPILVNGKVTEITEQEYMRYLNITDFIQNNGYEVSEQLGRVVILTRRRPISAPVIYFDNARLSSFDVLYNLSTASVERIIIDKTGLGEGLNAGFGGVIKIYTRTTPLFKKGSADKFSISKAPYAFQAAKKYYAPKYSSYLNSTFEGYGAISWIPAIKLSKSQATNFKVYDTRTKRITLFIEGISESGHLISEQKTIEVR